MAKPWILVLNAGSSSLKFAAFDLAFNRVSAGQADGHTPLDNVLEHLAMPDPPSVVGHRIVHGAALVAPQILTPEIRRKIVQAAKLAPLHNPAALAVIDRVQSRYPDLPQVLCFDTAFHSDNPAEATMLAIPQHYRDLGLRRYGFHGLSYQSVLRRFTAKTGKPLPRRVLAFHLGAGASLAAIVNGKGVATTMGFSPMDGLVMATRAGGMDSGVLLYMARELAMTPAQIDKVLNKESGLLALAGSASMKQVLATDSDAARFAVRHYCYWVARHAGSMIAAMQGVDGFVFTGGIGENAKPVRENIMARLGWLGAATQNIWVIPADEETEIARSAAQVLG